jgi:putative flippase GtrA
MTSSASLSTRLRGLVPEASKFLTVGAVAYVVDVGIFNLLRFAGDFAPLAGKPLTAKIISAIVATIVAYFGNKTWTYAHRAGQSATRELMLFFGLNGVAMAIAVVCLWISHYVLGLDSALADNISANIVGVGLGTIFRFLTYRRFVFTH